MTQTPCCTKDKSHPLFHQSVIQLTTVKLDFEQIRPMACVSSGFRCSLLFLALFVASKTLAKPGNSANSTPVSSTAAKPCNNVYNSFYAGPNKKIETFLQEMKEQLNHVEDDVHFIKDNQTLVKGKYRYVFWDLRFALKFYKLLKSYYRLASQNVTRYSFSCNPL